MTRSPRSVAGESYTLWAFHRDVKRWLPIFTGLPRRRAVLELVNRQDAVRRSGTPCRFMLRKDGEPPK